MPVLHERLVGLGYQGAEAAANRLIDRLTACGAAAPPKSATTDGTDLLVDLPCRDAIDLEVAVTQGGWVVFAEMAEALDRLHAAGLVHGAISSRSFAVGPNGRLALRDACLAAIVDGLEPTDAQPARREDVKAICRVATDLLAGTSGSGTSVPGTSVPIDKQGRRVVAVLRRHQRRPKDVGLLARDLRAEVDAAAEPSTICQQPPRPVRAPASTARPYRLQALLALTLAAAVPIGLAVAFSLVTSTPSDAHDPTTGTTAPSGASSASAPCPTGSLPALPGATVVAADVLRVSCAQPVEIAEGTVLTLGPSGSVVRFSLGRPGDQVVLGRWACGRALPAVYEPAAGVAYLFSAWPWPGQPASEHSGRAVDLGHTGGEAVAAPPGATCQHVEVRPG